MTARSEPIEGRCNARTANGYCRAYPPAGANRCKNHGGHAQAWSARLKHVTAEGQREIDEALHDPALLDVRRPIALAETIVANSSIVPSDDHVRLLARRMVARAVGPELVAVLREAAASGDTDAGRELLAELLEPTDGDMAAARLELQERSMRLVATYSKRQQEAVKTLQWAEVIRELALPLFAVLGGKLNAILRRFVPPEKLDAALGEIQNAFVVTLGELTAVKPK